MAMRPCSESISRLSDSSLTMMMVLENVNATATYKAVSGSIPKASDRPNPNTIVKNSCPRPVARATAPRLRTRCTSSFRPTTNNSTVMPIWASRSIGSCAVTHPVTDGLTTMPNTM